MIEQRFRRDYPGEFVVIETRWRDGKKEQVREWIDNPIENQHISGRAAVIGSNVDRYLFDYERLQRHRGGLLGKKRLQTYAVGDVIRDMRVDFAVETEDAKLVSILDTGYQVNNVVYTTARNCIAHPGEFYLIPYNPRLDVVALPLYLAAFDGHDEVYCLGYNNDTTSGTKNFRGDIAGVINAYPTVRFIFVGVEANIPVEWRQHTNVSCMTYRTWVSHCDVG